MGDAFYFAGSFSSPFCEAFDESVPMYLGKRPKGHFSFVIPQKKKRLAIHASVGFSTSGRSNGLHCLHGTQMDVTSNNNANSALVKCTVLIKVPTHLDFDSTPRLTMTLLHR